MMRAKKIPLFECKPEFIDRNERIVRILFSIFDFVSRDNRSPARNYARWPKQPHPRECRSRLSARSFLQAARRAFQLAHHSFPRLP
jgi:hypothetical protein